MTITQQEFGRAGLPDLSSMTEEEQIAYAMQMSLQGAGERLRPSLGLFPKGKPRRQLLCLWDWNPRPLQPDVPHSGALSPGQGLDLPEHWRGVCIAPVGVLILCPQLSLSSDRVCPGGGGRSGQQHSHGYL